MVSNNRRCLLSCLVPLALAGSCMVHAQPDLIADLALAIGPPLPATLEPGVSGILHVTVSNHGPDDAGFSIPDSHPIAVFSSLQMERPDGGIDVRFFPPDVPDGCILIATIIDPMPGARPQWAYGLHFQAIAAGDSATCSMRYALDPVVIERPAPIEWSVYTFTGTDPNPDNDSVPLVFNVGGVEPQAARPVPALHPLAIVLLLLASLGAGTRTLRGRLDPQSRRFSS